MRCTWWRGWWWSLVTRLSRFGHFIPSPSVLQPSPFPLRTPPRSPDLIRGGSWCDWRWVRLDHRGHLESRPRGIHRWGYGWTLEVWTSTTLAFSFAFAIVPSFAFAIGPSFTLIVVPSFALTLAPSFAIATWVTLAFPHLIGLRLHIYNMRPWIIRGLRWHCHPFTPRALTHHVPL